MGQILHLFIYDHKFINNIIAMWECACPEENIYVVFEDRSAEEKAKILSRFPSIIFLSPSREDSYSQIRALAVKSDFGLVHFCSVQCLRLLKEIEPFPWVWCAWGGDWYFYRNALTLETLRVIHPKRPVCSIKFLEYLKSRRLYRKIRYYKYLEAWARFRYFAPVLPNEYRFLQKDFPGRFNARVFDYSEGWFYLKAERMLPTAQNILIGNSASPYNNHLTIFAILKKWNLKNRKIIVPLSYGNMEYAKNVEKEGTRLWGNDFVPINNFMQYEKYTQLLVNCVVAFFPALRQMGVGNIIILLGLGTRLYFPHDSPTYLYLKKEGFSVFSIEADFSPETPDALAPLSAELQQHNRELMEKHWGKNVVIDKAGRLAAEIRSEIKI